VAYILFHLQDIRMAQNSLAVIQVRLWIKENSKLSVCPIVPHSNHQLSDSVLFFLLAIHLFNHSCILSFSYMFLHSFVLLFTVYVHRLQVSIMFVQNLLHYLGLGNKPFFASYCHLIVYAPDMPNRLPVKDFVGGLVTNILRALKYWLHYTLVALAWLGVVPITACKWKFTLLHFLLIFKSSVIIPRCTCIYCIYVG